MLNIIASITAVAFIVQAVMGGSNILLSIAAGALLYLVITWLIGDLLRAVTPIFVALAAGVMWILKKTIGRMGK